MPAKPVFTRQNAAEYGRKGAIALAAKRRALAELAAKAPPNHIQVLIEHLRHIDELIKHCNRSAELDRLGSARGRFQDQLLQLQNPAQDKPKRAKQSPTEPRPEAKPVGYTTTNSVQGNLE